MMAGLQTDAYTLYTEVLNHTLASGAYPLYMVVINHTIFSGPFSNFVHMAVLNHRLQRLSLHQVLANRSIPLVHGSEKPYIIAAVLHQVLAKNKSIPLVHVVINHTL